MDTQEIAVLVDQMNENPTTAGISHITASISCVIHPIPALHTNVLILYHNPQNEEKQPGVK